MGSKSQESTFILTDSQLLCSPPLPKKKIGGLWKTVENTRADDNVKDILAPKGKANGKGQAGKEEIKIEEWLDFTWLLFLDQRDLRRFSVCKAETKT